MSVFTFDNPGEDRSRMFRFRRLLVTGLLIVSAVTNVLLVYKVRQLRGVITALKDEDVIQAGVHLPPLTAQDLAGQITTVRFDDTDRATLLYVFTPSCGWCKKNEDNIKALTTQTGNKVRFVGLSLSQEGLKEYVAQKLPSAMVVTPDARTVTAYKLTGTPETILVSPAGIVLRVWKGAYADSSKREVEEYFQVKLPGLRSTS